MSNIAFTLNGQDIEGSFYQKVIKLCNNDRFEAGRVFFRAVHNNAENIQGWIRKGFEPPERYAMKPVTPEYENGESVRYWIDQNIFKVQDGMVQVRHILKNL